MPTQPFELNDKIQRMMDLINPPALRAIAEVQNLLSFPTLPFQAVAKMEAAIKVHSIVQTIAQGAVVSKYLDTFRQLDALQSIKWAGPIVDYAAIATLPARAYELFNRDWEEDEEVEESPSIGRIFLDEGKRLKAIIYDIYKDNKNLMKLSPRGFEEVIEELLRSQGFETELTKQTRDGGFDIRAIHKIAGGFPIMFLVECKRYREDRPIGVDIVRAFKEVLLEEGANKGILVATSYFSDDAKKKQQKIPWLLDYRDKDAVMEWVDGYSLRNGLLLPNHHS